MDALEKELNRYGSVWLEDDEGKVQPGYVRLEKSPPYVKPGGAPARRPWGVACVEAQYPSCVARQAENDNTSGTDAADNAMEEGFYVTKSTTAGAPSVFLDPRNVAGAEKFNLPAGRWKCVALARSITVESKLKWRVLNESGTAVATGAQVNVPVSAVVVEVDLGVLSVPIANHGANWYDLEAEASSGSNRQVHVDRLRFTPTGAP